MAFECVAKLAQIPRDRGLRIRLRGREIGLYRVGDFVYAMEDVCPHAGYPLSEGELEGTLVICPGHAWEFDLTTGRAPGETDETPLARYRVRIDGDDVWLDPDAVLGR
jgi:nitrite reductase/ring-hydroxylating ferredoxin subunit